MRADDGARRLALEKRLTAGAWLTVIVLGLLHAWAARHEIQPDGVSYLDVADKYLAGDWRWAINAYWSPLYSWLLGLALLVVRPTPYWEYPLVHFVNFLIYLCAFACLQFFLFQLIRSQGRASESATGREPIGLPGWAWQVLACVLFLWCGLFLVSLSNVTPDMCVVALVFLASALLIKIRLSPIAWGQFIWLGLILALAYFAKAVMFPLAFVFLMACAVSVGKPSKALPRALVAASVFLVVSSPFLLALHEVKGRWTFSDTGQLAYAWLVSDADPQFIHWRGKPSGSGTPAHPTAQIFEHPDAFEYKEPMRVTFAPWYDASYWNEGLVGHFNMRGQLRVLGRGALRYYAVFINSPFGMAIAVGFLALSGYSGGIFQSMSGVRAWSVLLPAIGAFGLYALVHVETRYLGGFVVITWLVFFAGIKLPGERASVRVMTSVMLAIVSACMVVVIAKSIVPATFTVRDLIRGEEASAAQYWRVADALNRMGVHPGDQVGFIGYGIAAGSYWARLAKVHIIADIGTGTEYVPKSDVDTFWHAAADVKRKVIEAFAKTGAKAIVANKIPPGHADPGWQRIGDTDAFIYFLQ